MTRNPVFSPLLDVLRREDREGPAIRAAHDAKRRSDRIGLAWVTLVLSTVTTFATLVYRSLGAGGYATYAGLSTNGRDRSIRLLCRIRITLRRPMFSGV
jgi:hypothetical protein